HSATPTLSLHDALPIYGDAERFADGDLPGRNDDPPAPPPAQSLGRADVARVHPGHRGLDNAQAAHARVARCESSRDSAFQRAWRSEEHTSELQSLRHLV